MSVSVYLPDSQPGPTSASLAPSPSSLNGLRIGVLDNGKPNAEVVMIRAAEYLATRTGAIVSVITKKGPLGLSANAAIPLAPDRLELLVAECDIILTGAADCGSCTAYSVHDAIELEKHGKPTVVATTTHFEPVAKTLSTSFGAPETRLLVLPHPIGGTDERTLGAWAEAASDRLIALFTGKR
jgi:hypothetical protein